MLLFRDIYCDKILQKGDDSEMVEIKIDASKCDGCGTCKDTCPVAVYEINDEKSHAVSVNDCLACRACEVQCPNQCIQIIE